MKEANSIKLSPHGEDNLPPTPCSAPQVRTRRGRFAHTLLLGLILAAGMGPILRYGDVTVARLVSFAFLFYMLPRILLRSKMRNWLPPLFGHMTCIDRREEPARARCGSSDGYRAVPISEQLSHTPAPSVPAAGETPRERHDEVDLLIREAHAFETFADPWIELERIALALDLADDQP